MSLLPTNGFKCHCSERSKQPVDRNWTLVEDKETDSVVRCESCGEQGTTNAVYLTTLREIK